MIFQEKETEKTDHSSSAKVGRLGDLFLQKGLLTESQVELIAAEQRQKKLRFGDAALNLGFLSQIQIDSALGEQFGFGSKDLINGKADSGLRFFHYPFSKEAEEIRRLRSELLLKFSSQDKIKIALVSASPQEGKSYMAASLAIALSQVGRRTLLIDADLRSGNLHNLFSLGSPDGLSSVLAGRIAAQNALIPLMDNLHILPSGPRPPNPLEILRAPRIRELLASCDNQFDAFVLDTYTSSLASDAQMVAHQVGSVLLMAMKDVTLLSDLREAKSDMQAAGAEVIGTIFNENASGDGTGRLSRKWLSWVKKRLPYGSKRTASSRG
ncbi:polysaccharide biosynthesis tyrosine autokinase [Undibacterium sp. Dicai25W]|uniref:CpsD/CapB family tyrosine-protein kinase n=1 Tax=Undibacterium sp. Dicai25W TaxID=3413034 RepID=UPI003BF45345